MSGEDYFFYSGQMSGEDAEDFGFGGVGVDDVKMVFDDKSEKLAKGDEVAKGCDGADEGREDDDADAGGLEESEKRRVCRAAAAGHGNIKIAFKPAGKVSHVFLGSAPAGLGDYVEEFRHSS